jgi:hypothetical protein
MPPLPPWAIDAQSIFEYYTFGYKVDRSPAWMGFVVFLLLAFVHTPLTYMYARKAKYMYLITLTALMESFGYLTRILTLDEKTLDLIMVTNLLLVVPPIIFAVVNYKIIGKLLSAVNKNVWCVKAAFITRLFLLGDIICFIVQSAGASLLFVEDVKIQKNGGIIILLGLALQFGLFFVFAICTLKAWTFPEYSDKSTPMNVKRIFYVCFSTIGLLFIRNAYRIYEFERTLYKIEHFLEEASVTEEWEFYVFEFTPVFLCHIIYTVYNFGWIMGDEEEFNNEMKTVQESLGLTVVTSTKSSSNNGTTTIEKNNLHLRNVVNKINPSEGEGVKETTVIQVVDGSSTSTPNTVTQP